MEFDVLSREKLLIECPSFRSPAGEVFAGKNFNIDYFIYRACIRTENKNIWVF